MGTFEKAYNYKTKLERDRDRRAQNSRMTSLEPTNDVQKAIKARGDTFTKHQHNLKNLTAADAVAEYLAIEKLRHNLWCQFLLENRQVGVPCDFNDVSLKEFYRKLSNMLNITIPEPEKELTPDVLFYSDVKRTVMLGDIAVTTSRDTEKRKREKYMIIERELGAVNISTHWVPFILMSDKSNLNAILYNYKLLGIIIDNPELSLVELYHDSCNNMLSVYPKLVDTTNFNRILDRNRGNDDSQEFVYTLPDNCPDLQNLEEFEIGDNDEEDLIAMIKKKTDENLEGYFDEGFDSSMSSFNEIEEGYKNSASWQEPKSTLKMVYNAHDMEDKVNYDLIVDYLEDISEADDVVANYIRSLLPSKSQVSAMRTIYNSDDKKEKNRHKCNNVFGPYQYLRRYNPNHLTDDLNSKLKLGKNNRNEKTAPETLNFLHWSKHEEDIDRHCDYLGEISSKPPILDNEWLASNNTEAFESNNMLECYKYVKSTNGAQLAHSASSLFQRLTHLRTSESLKDNVFIPPNCSFICIIPKEHSPFNRNNSDVPMIFITRLSIKDSEDMTPPFEHECSVEGRNYVYYTSKLCRLPIEKVSNWENAGYRLVMVASYLMSRSDVLYDVRKRLTGVLTMMTLDVHQKTSEYLDLLKYVAYMPFASVSRLSKLITDKFSIMMKTKLDVWTYMKMKKFMIRLSKTDKIYKEAKKPALKLFNGMMTPDSVGMKVKLPSFFNENNEHDNIEDFIEEVNGIYSVRAKHLYGNQFMDSSINKTAEWNLEYEREVREYGNWLTDGMGEGDFPFDAKFAFSSKAIVIANNHFMAKSGILKSKVDRSLSGSLSTEYMHYNCSLRGCLIPPSERVRVGSKVKYHSTSIAECLKRYKKDGYSDVKAKADYIACDALAKGVKADVSMSAKKQKGPGRPIATGTLETKALFMMIEKPEEAIGKLASNNILVTGKNKQKEQCDAYKEACARGATEGFKCVYQLTEDQSKFSENDNTRKYKPYISTNTYLHENIRKLQLACMDTLIGRFHLNKTLPKSITEKPELSKYADADHTGVYAYIGWPQGMLNAISTSVHQIADLWITDAFNMAYGNGEKIIHTSGLVHSDDSWVTVCCNNEETFKKFVLFRMYAKRLFCLKLNEKKVYGSHIIGEIVSNYNINGTVHSSLVKVIANALNNLQYMNWVQDVSNQISVLQQVYRLGANLPTMIMMNTVLKNQLFSAYNVKSKVTTDGKLFRQQNIHNLPIELGGYPSCSIFELATCGTKAHANDIYDKVRLDPKSEVSTLISKTIGLSIVKNNSNKYLEAIESYKSDEGYISIRHVNELNINDFEQLNVPDRGAAFSCIKHLAPRTNKITDTMNLIYELPFEATGLEQIITRPLTLAEALGNLKSQSNSLIYSLASEHYSESSRRLACAQAMQSTGRTVLLDGLKPMTFSELYRAIYIIGGLASPLQVEAILADEDGSCTIARSISRHAELIEVTRDKRKVLNRLPDTDTKYNTILPLKDVLLHIIDKYSDRPFNPMTSLASRYAINKDHESTILEQDMINIRNRFRSFFLVYKAEYCCNLIMQMANNYRKAKLWIQPSLNNKDLTTFYSTLYGKTISDSASFIAILPSAQRVKIDKTKEKMVDTMYTIEVLNEVYSSRDYKDGSGSFIIREFCGKKPAEVLMDIDYSNLSTNAKYKYAVLQSIHNNNNQYILEASKSEDISIDFINPQVYRQNRWVGEFKAICCYGNNVLKIEGEPGQVLLTTNTKDPTVITHIMHRFVINSFLNEKYAVPSLWMDSRLWRSNVAQLSRHRLRLVSITSSVTRVCDGGDGLALVFDKYLTHDSKSSYTSYRRIDIKDSLRNVVGITNSGKEIRLFNIRQELSMPMWNDVKLEHSLLFGLDVNDLIKQELLTSIMKKKFYSCDEKQARELLCKKMSGLTPSNILAQLFMRIASLWNENVVINLPEEVSAPEYETLEVTEQTGYAILEHVEVPPESLEYMVEDEKELFDTVRVGSFFVCNNFIKVLSACCTPRLNRNSKIAILQGIVTDSHASKILTDYMDECSTAESLSWGAGVESLREIDENYEEAISGVILDDKEQLVMYTILANGMLEGSFWERINRHTLSTFVPTESPQSLINTIVNCLHRAIMNEDIPKSSLFGEKTIKKIQRI